MRSVLPVFFIRHSHCRLRPSHPPRRYRRHPLRRCLRPSRPSWRYCFRLPRPLSRCFDGRLPLPGHPTSLDPGRRASCPHPRVICSLLGRQCTRLGRICCLLVPRWPVFRRFFHFGLALGPFPRRFGRLVHPDSYRVQVGRMPARQYS